MELSPHILVASNNDTLMLPARRAVAGTWHLETFGGLPSASQPPNWSNLRVITKGFDRVAFIDKPVPQPGPNDAVIKTTRALICTPDSHTGPGAIETMDKKLDGSH